MPDPVVSPADDLKALHQKRNRLAGYAIGGLVGGMLLLSFASVPLYRLYCQVTGFGGRAVASEADKSMPVLDREVVVRFNTDVDASLPWAFKPDQGPVKVPIGKEVLVSFTATNSSSEPVAGTALFNVSPPTAGAYFHKTQCFCFNYQVIAPGETVHFPVVFYVDPKMASDRELDDLKSLTLSYTFYKADSEHYNKALEAFYNGEKSVTTSGE